VKAGKPRPLLAIGRAAGAWMREGKRRLLPDRFVASALPAVILLLAGIHSAGAAPGLPVTGYDDALCVTAQRLLVGQPSIPVRVQTGTGNGFYTIQMGIDEQARGLAVAMTTGVATSDGADYPSWVACKMVNRARANDVLGLATDAPERTCRDVNEHTWQVAINRLSADDRRLLAGQARNLQFAPDTVLPTGGEWLPADLRDSIERLPDGSYRVSAPSVVVPWDPVERGFFQGTRHCKLLTLATVEQWLRATIAGRSAELLPVAARACALPEQLESRAGSCLFYFAPVAALVCQDYSGATWTPAAAARECGRRHASRAALEAEDKRYEGRGGIFSQESCAARTDTPARSGTCVFRCGAGDETLWHLPVAPGKSPAIPTGRFCDVYVPAAPQE
jgi:hypothetical protein